MNGIIVPQKATEEDIIYIFRGGGAGTLYERQCEIFAKYNLEPPRDRWAKKDEPKEEIEEEVDEVESPEPKGKPRKKNPYQKKAWRDAKIQAKKRDMTCTNCRTSQNLTVHHKDHNAHNNDLNNLETLCWRCHSRHHKHMKSQPPSHFKF